MDTTEEMPLEPTGVEPLPLAAAGGVRSPSEPRRWWVSPARWAGELGTVFVGVYAAFTLNNYQTHRQERQRRDQIIAWAQIAYTDLLTGVTNEEAVERKAHEEFEGRIKAGETPVLHASNFNTDYNPADFTSLLQSGGFDLLEIETVRAIREVEGTLRQMVALAQHHEQLGDALILPNLDQPASFFYEASARQLRPGYAWYLNDQEIELKYYEEIRAETTRLLAQLRTERARNR